MKKVYLSLLLSLLSICLFANWQAVTENQNLETFEYQAENLNSTAVQFNLNGYEIENINANGSDYLKLSHPEAGELLNIGKPDLPVFTKMIAVPNSGNVSYEILSYDIETLSDINIYPRQELQSDSDILRADFVIDNAFYAQDINYPNSIITLSEPEVMRDIRLVNLTINPFHYNPLSKELTVYKNVEVAVTTDNSIGKNQLVNNRKKSRFFEPIYKALILNYETTQTRDDEFQQPSYLFIYPNNDDVEDNLELLAEWKHLKGFEVTSVSTATTGNSLSQIKNYIQNAYDNWDVRPEFVCLVGDANGSYNIPTGEESYGEGDHYYTTLAGNDLMEDIFIGRLSFNSIIEFQTIISKILNYEKTPYMGNTDWYERGLLVGDPSHSGSSTITTCKYTKHIMQQHEPNYTFNEYYDGNYVNGIQTTLNEGATYFNYRGYIGMSNWSNNNTSSLNNGFMLPVVVIITCGTGNFSSPYDDARSEYFTKAGSPTQPKGAIATIGTATSSTHTCFNNSVSAGIFHGIFVDGIYNMGGALVRGKLNMLLNYPSNPGNWCKKFSYWNNLMGDPGMEVWTGVPQSLDVQYNEYLAAGANYLEVYVEDGDGFPLENAWVTALKGNDEIFVTGWTDTEGYFYLELPADETGEVDLTVTAHNHIPHLGSFHLQQQPQFVNIHGMNITEDNSDGGVNPAETVGINLTLKNFGSLAVNGVEASISTDNPFVTITQATNIWGDFTTDQAITVNNAFTLDIAPDAVGNSLIDIDVTITDADVHEWKDKIYLTIEGPQLEAVDFNIIGGNGILDPGETVDLEVILSNLGNVNAENVNAEISTYDGRLTINDNTGTYTTIYANNVVGNISDRFNITASDDIIPGSLILMTLELTTTTGLNQTTFFNLEVGTPTINDPVGPDAYGYYAFDDGDTDYYNAPVYDWIELDPNYGGDGSVFDFQDGGNNGDYEVIPVPADFHLQMYGEVYDSLTICSNGWIAPGTHHTDNFMNWIVPGPMGPSPIIAPFWDDLKLGEEDWNGNYTPNGGVVCYKYDQGSHQIIIEWSHLENEYNNAEETFQVILYDPSFYPTTTNDNEFKFQYKVVNNVDQGEYSYGVQHGQYATVGIEDESTTIGLQYTFNNTYPTAAKHLQNEMAILVTAPPIPSNGPYLYFSDLGINSGGDEIIEHGETAYLSSTLKNIGPDIATNASVTLELADEYVTIVNGYEVYGTVDSNGEITIENAFQLDISDNVPDHHYFNILATIVCDQETWERNINLLVIAEPHLYVDTPLLDVEVGQGETFQTSMVISNDVAGSGNLHYQMRIEEPVTGRNLSGSNLNSNTYVFEPGSTVEWIFSVHNLSQDSEWITDINIHFPYGTSVIEASDFVGGSGGDMVWNGAVGENVDVNWHGSTDLGYGYLHQNQVAVAAVTVEIDEIFTGNILLEYELVGDGYGDAPHIITDTLEIRYPLGWVSVNPHEGDLRGGESETINITFDADEMELGDYVCSLIINDGSDYETVIPVDMTVVATDSDDDTIPVITELAGNYPNPFNPETNIYFSLSEASEVELNIYNIKGKKVKTLLEGFCDADYYNLTWMGDDNNGKKVASGVYFYKMKTNKYVATKKMILLK